MTRELFTKIYTRINWKNRSEAMTTALGATLLNRMDYTLDESDTRIVALDVRKAEESEVLQMVKEWSMDEQTGIITVTKKNGEQIVFDLNIEKIPVSFTLSPQGILTMTTDDGTEFTADIGSMIPILTFKASDTVSVTVEGTGINKTYSFSVIEGSIKDKHMQPSYLADITAQAQAADESAGEAQTEADRAKTEADRAKTAADKAEQAAESAEQIAGIENLANAISRLTPTYDETMAILAGVKTVTVTLSANDGADMGEQTVTLLNVATGKEVTKEYDPDGIVFDVFGETEYLLSASDMDDHVTPDSVKILITEGEGQAVDIEYNLKPLNDLPWAKIIEVSESGNASVVFAIHDTKEIELTTGEKIVVEIVGFDHDILADSTEETAGISFGTKDCLATKYAMYNSSVTNLGGWSESQMRTETLKDHFYDVLPEDLKAGIKPAYKKTPSWNSYNTLVPTIDDVWLFSDLELLTNGGYPGFLDITTRKKHLGRGGSDVAYLLRTPVTSSNATSRQFKYVTVSGTVTGTSSINIDAKVPNAVAVGFCI